MSQQQKSLQSFQFCWNGKQIDLIDLLFEHTEVHSWLWDHMMKYSERNVHLLFQELLTKVLYFSHMITSSTRWRSFTLWRRQWDTVRSYWTLSLEYFITVPLLWGAEYLQYSSWRVCLNHLKKKPLYTNGRHAPQYSKWWMRYCCSGSVGSLCRCSPHTECCINIQMED